MPSAYTNYSGLKLWPQTPHAGPGQTGWWTGQFYEMPNGDYYYQNRDGVYKLVKVNSLGANPSVPQPERKHRKMATVNICERCGALGKEQVMTTLTLSDDKNDDDREICSTCRLEFDSWWVTDAPNRQGTSVTDQYVDAPKVAEETRMMARVIAEEFARAQAAAKKAITNGE